MEWPKYIMLLFVVFLANVYGVAFDVKGVIPAVLTPFDNFGNVNISVIPEYVNYLASEFVDGILVGGIDSEVPTLYLDERKILLDAWVKAAHALNLSVTHEVGGLPMADVLELAKYSESLGVDALMIIPNKTNMPTDVNSLVKYVSEVAQAAPTLQILYHHPYWLSDFDIADIVGQLKNQNIKFFGILGNCDEAENVGDLLDKDYIFIEDYFDKAYAWSRGYYSNMCEVTGLFPKQMVKISRYESDYDIANGHQEYMDNGVRYFAQTEDTGL